VWTSAGSAAGLDMCLELVRQDLGAAVANELARRIVVPPHRDGGQAQFIRPSTRGTAPRPDVQEWARHHMADATVVAMAEHAGVSTRTLNRQFRAATGRSPQAWLQGLRLDTAAELLETIDLGTGAVARTPWDSEPRPTCTSSSPQRTAYRPPVTAAPSAPLRAPLDATQRWECTPARSWRAITIRCTWLVPS
jgi:AraC-like DNA-binding protein